ncbi:EF-hand domain-containing protein [Sphingomonas sp. ID0503]|uniref:EF-hand domain-containing protein n=1 Tax=Sphingomonas sp. ID0503 TaxID=3399691 RepID=UPI003AFA9CC6
MRKFLTLGLVSLATVAAMPALADQAKQPRGPETRAEAQTKAEQHFARFDTDRNGVVTKTEFDAAREKMRGEWQAKRAERHGERFAKLDADKNGQLSKAEWDAGAAHRGAGKGADAKGSDRDHRGYGMHRMSGHGGGRWFDRLDANKDGQVTRAEAVAARLAIFDKVDANKDGTVTPEERKAGWDAKRAEWKAKRG